MPSRTCSRVTCSAAVGWSLLDDLVGRVLVATVAGAVPAGWWGVSEGPAPHRRLIADFAVVARRAPYTT
ncbi:hypothetical protein [Streptomyces chryseus]